MKQAMIEIWMENKTPLYLGIKIILIMCLLFMGVMLAGFPYSGILVSAVIAIKCISVKKVSQIEYLLPRTNKEYRKIVIIKSVTGAAFYSIINSLGYVLLISIEDRYRWDMEMVAYIAVLTAVVFFLYMMYMLLMENVQNATIVNMSADGRKKILIRIFTAGILPFIAISQIHAFIQIKFAEIYWFVFLGKWQGMFNLAMAVIVTIGIIICIVRELKYLKLNEYC